MASIRVFRCRRCLAPMSALQVWLAGSKQSNPVPMSTLLSGLRASTGAVHRPHRTIAVIDLQREPGSGDVRLDALERRRRILAQNAFGRLITGKRPADEIVETGIADVLGDARINVAEVDETCGQSTLASSETWNQRRKRGGGKGSPAST